MTLLSMVKLVHLLGLIMGFGGAILADLMILRFAILKPVERQIVNNARVLSHIVFAGLGLLWLSGAALVYIRYSADANVLNNQKIWAKVIIVSFLTVNGIAVHRFALSHLASRLGHQLFDVTKLSEMASLTMIAGISSVSWMLPFVLGVATEFNYKVPASQILGVYAALILVAWAAFYTLARVVTKPELGAVASPMTPAINDPAGDLHAELLRRFAELGKRVKASSNHG